MSSPEGSPTTVSLVLASPDQRPLLENLFQFYCYDFAEIVGLHVGDDGRYSAPPLTRYWTEEHRYPFLIEVQGHRAGFVLIQKQSRITGSKDTWDIAEFFVMRAYRQQGVGTRVAIELFERYRGRWEIRQVPTNQSATRFWRRVLGRYTAGEYTEQLLHDERWKGFVQSFDNTAPAFRESTR